MSKKTRSNKQREKKSTKDMNVSSAPANPETQVDVENTEARGREGDFRIAQAPERGAVRYERKEKLQIPEEIVEAFANAGDSPERGWHIRFIGWELNGQEDTRNLARRMTDDGYVFVTKDELPEWYVASLDERTLTRHRSEALVVGDSVLMKAPMWRVQGRKSFYADKTAKQVNAVNRNLKGGKFVDGGTKTTVSYKEPSFDG